MADPTTADLLAASTGGASTAVAGGANGTAAPGSDVTAALTKNLTSTLLGNSGMVSSDDTGLETLVNNAVKGINANNDATKTALGDEHTLQLQDEANTENFNLNQGREAGGLGVITANLQSVVDASNTRIDALNKQYNDALKSADTNTATQVNDLILKEYTLQQTNTQNAFDNALKVYQAKDQNALDQSQQALIASEIEKNQSDIAAAGTLDPATVASMASAAYKTGGSQSPIFSLVKTPAQAAAIYGQMDTQETDQMTTAIESYQKAGLSSGDVATKLATDPAYLFNTTNGSFSAAQNYKIQGIISKVYGSGATITPPASGEPGIESAGKGLATGEVSLASAMYNLFFGSKTNPYSFENGGVQVK